MVIVTHESYDSVLVGTGKHKGLESLCVKNKMEKWQNNLKSGRNRNRISEYLLNSIFWLCVVWIRKYYFPCLLFSALCETAYVYDYKRVSLHDSLTTRVQVTSSLNALTLAIIALPLLAPVALECTKCVFGQGSVTDPTGGAYIALLYPLTDGGLVLRGRRGEWERKGKGGTPLFLTFLDPLLMIAI